MAGKKPYVKDGEPARAYQAPAQQKKSGFSNDLDDDQVPF
jgi:hypothetical protein